MLSFNRLRAAGAAAGIHFFCSLAVAFLAGILVFGLWYPFPYRELSGGRELFLLVVTVDVVCGPLLTMVLFNPAKPRAELWRDLSWVILIQLAALGYGLFNVWQARPLFLVLEIDRFKVVTAPSLESKAIDELPDTLRPKWWSGPKIVAIRLPKDNAESDKVMFEAVQGGRDFAERPEFYLPYDEVSAQKSLNKAKPLSLFLQRWPSQKVAATNLVLDQKLDVAQLRYLPVIGRQDWVAVLDQQGKIRGYLKGDGF